MTAPAVAFSEADWEGMREGAEPAAGWKPMDGPGHRARQRGARVLVELLIRPRLLAALQRFNPTVPAQYLQQALAEIASPKSNDAIAENHRIHNYLVDGYRLSYIDSDGNEANPTIHLVSQDPDQNDWLAVNQVTLVQGDYKRRFDVVLYCNGMPVSVIELKKAGSAHADVACAPTPSCRPTSANSPWRSASACSRSPRTGSRPSTARRSPPSTTSRPGTWTMTVCRSHRATWIDGDAVTALETALDGLYNQERFLQLIRNFTAFDEGSDGLAKRIAKPHQYFAVTKAVGSTVQAVESNGKAGVVWHTQGSGKSMEMELYANLVARHPKLKNPTVVVITDRNELDGQLFEGFDRSLLLAESPKQIKKRSELRDELSNRTTGGIYFTTLQKFGRSKSEKDAGADHPLLSDRRNIIVVVDEAHRSHYDDLDGYARHLRDALPHATLIAFTGTPISFDDRNTQDVFGDYIDIYDLSRAVEDGATVPVYFEPRLIKVGLAVGRHRRGSLTRPPTRPRWAWTIPSGHASRRASPS